jgi:hypothetical protein
MEKGRRFRRIADVEPCAGRIAFKRNLRLASHPQLAGEWMSGGFIVSTSRRNVIGAASKAAPDLANLERDIWRMGI